MPNVFEYLSALIGLVILAGLFGVAISEAANDFLSKMVGAANAMLFITFLIAGGVLGHILGQMLSLQAAAQDQQKVYAASMALGLLAGLVFGVFVCGLLALLVSTNRHIVLMEQKLDALLGPALPPPTQITSEPPKRHDDLDPPPVPRDISQIIRDN